MRDAFHAAWGEGARLDDPEVLARLAEARGWDAAGFLRYVDSPAAAAALESATAQAVARGVFGVPTMTIGSDMWWGNDRLFMLERHLAKIAADRDTRQAARAADPGKYRTSPYVTNATIANS